MFLINNIFNSNRFSTVRKNLTVLFMKKQTILLQLCEKCKVVCVQSLIERGHILLICKRSIVQSAIERTLAQYFFKRK